MSLSYLNFYYAIHGMSGLQSMIEELPSHCRDMAIGAVGRVIEDTMKTMSPQEHTELMKRYPGEHADVNLLNSMQEQGVFWYQKAIADLKNKYADTFNTRLGFFRYSYPGQSTQTTERMMAPAEMVALMECRMGSLISGRGARNLRYDADVFGNTLQYPLINQLYVIEGLPFISQLIWALPSKYHFKCAQNAMLAIKGVVYTLCLDERLAFIAHFDQASPLGCELERRRGVTRTTALRLSDEVRDLHKRLRTLYEPPAYDWWFIRKKRVEYDQRYSLHLLLDTTISYEAEVRENLNAMDRRLDSIALADYDMPWGTDCKHVEFSGEQWSTRVVS